MTIVRTYVPVIERITVRVIVILIVLVRVRVEVRVMAMLREIVTAIVRVSVVVAYLQY